MSTTLPQTNDFGGTPLVSLQAIAEAIRANGTDCEIVPKFAASRLIHAKPPQHACSSAKAQASSQRFSKAPSQAAPSPICARASSTSRAN